MLQISQKTFLLGGFLAFLVAGTILFTLHNHALDPEASGNWWAVRFVEPGNSRSLEFEIENYSNILKGNYSISIDEALLESRDIDISNNTTTRFSPQTRAPLDTRVKVMIKLGNEERSLTR